MILKDLMQQGKRTKGAVKKAKASRIAYRGKMISENQSELFQHSHMIHSLEKRMIIAERQLASQKKNWRLGKTGITMEDLSRTAIFGWKAKWMMRAFANG